MIKYNFTILILTHGRSSCITTVDLLHKSGYTGTYKLVLDNEDETAEDYIARFGKDSVYIFNKTEYSMCCDTMFPHTKDERRDFVLFARNKAWDIAKDLGVDYFLVLDDDYDQIRMRYEEDNVLRTLHVKDLDSIINTYLDFLIQSNADCVAFSQIGDFIGGMTSTIWHDRVLRKIMNSFFLRTDRPFEFFGQINEDVNAYTYWGSRGKLFLTPREISISQKQTQLNKSGLTDIYLSLGTYVKSFFSVIIMPSAVKVSMMGVSHLRLHHLVSWNNCVPKIISSKYQKL